MNFKNYFPLLGFFLVSFIADGNKDNIGVPGPLTYNGTVFNLVKSHTDSINYYEQYYIPEGEKLDSFRQMMSIFVYDSAYDPNNAANNQVLKLEERKKTDAMCNYQKILNNEKKEYMVDFTTGETSGEYLLAMQFTIYRYKKISLGKKRPGLVVYGYSSQRYLDSITTYMKTLGTERISRLNEMGAVLIPEITLPKK